MIDASAVGEIIKQYEKHGWKLRRALLSAGGRKALKGLDTTEIVASDLDALLFSRQTKTESEAWELRRLTGSPFALVAVIPTDASEEDVASTLDQLIEEMREKTIA